MEKPHSPIDHMLSALSPEEQDLLVEADEEFVSVMKTRAKLVTEKDEKEQADEPKRTQK